MYFVFLIPKPSKLHNFSDKKQPCFLGNSIDLISSVRNFYENSHFLYKHSRKSFFSNQFKVNYKFLTCISTCEFDC